MARHFTKQEIEEIRKQLSTTAVRDLELPETLEMTDSDYVAVVQNGINKKFNWAVISHAENERIANENERVNAENARAAAEVSRSNTEETRVEAEESRVLAENARVNAEASRVDVESSRVNAEAARALAENARVEAETARETQAGADHTRAEGDHEVAVGDHTQAGEDHAASSEATDRANEAAAAAEHMVDIHRGPKGDQGNTGSSVDYPYELVNNLTTEDATKGLSAQMGVTLDGKISQLGQDLADLADSKVNKEEGKSLIDADYAASKSTIENPEYLEVTTDSEDKVLEGIKEDGTKVLGGNLNVAGDAKILGNMEVSGVSYKIVENPEYLAAWVDVKDRVIFGLKADGKTYICDADFLDAIKSNQGAISEMNDILSTVYNSMNSLDINALTSITAVENQEFMSAETDSEGKVLSGRGADGIMREFVGFDINGNTIKTFSDPEGRIEVKTDSKSKVLSYRDSSGVLHESSGVDTKVVTAENIYGGNIDSCNFYTGELLCVERPKIAEMWFTGKLPTDTSDARIPTDLNTVFKVNGKTIFKCRCTLALQGHGTLTLPKQGYTFEPYNESGDAISIKFGDMIATDSFHLKGYYTDPLQCKDIGNYHIYADMLKHLDYPYCRMNNISGDYASAYSKNKCSFGDAKYVPDGFPVLLFLNGNFHGIYTLKLKKTRQNYAMEKSTKAQIFLDAQGENRSFFNQAFREDGWDLKNPKIKGYEEGGTITDTGVLENIQRLWSFTTDFRNQYENYSDYIVLPHWILYLIFQELIGNWDSVGNNINVVTWDAKHWSIIPWDTDESLGVTHAKNIDTTASNVVVGDIWSDFRTVFADDISAMWTMMRNSGVITVSNLLSYYKDIVAVIPREYYEKDMKKWGNYYLNGVYTINTLAECLKNKIEFLDSIWYNQN